MSRISFAPRRTLGALALWLWGCFSVNLSRRLRTLQRGGVFLAGRSFSASVEPAPPDAPLFAVTAVRPASAVSLTGFLRNATQNPLEKGDKQFSIFRLPLY